VLLENHVRVFQLAGRLTELVGEPLEQIDVGGGLGIPYAEDHVPLDVVNLGRGLADLLARAPWFPGELVLEPGRFLAGPCGVYLARVVRTKTSRGSHFAILEGGANHLLRPLLTMEPFPARAVGADEGAPLSPTVLAGPLCTSLDRLGTVSLPPLAPGDLVALGQTGAYGFTESMPLFLSHPPAREVWIDE
jgi:diaminopimelate decarboxylase